MSHAEFACAVASTALYGAGAVLLIASWIRNRETWGKAGGGVLAAALVLQTAAVAIRWVAAGHGPWLPGFERAFAGAWTLAILAMAVTSRRPRLRPALAVSSLVILGLVAYAWTRPIGHAPLGPSFRTGWLFVHVTASRLAYGAFALAGSAALVYLLLDRAANGKKDGSRPGLETLDDFQFRLLAFGFVAQAVMLCSGAIWARNLWGSYWGWDPVETWSLVVWLVYGLYLHLRIVFGWRGRRAAIVALIALAPVGLDLWGLMDMVQSRHFGQILDMTVR